MHISDFIVGHFGEILRDWRDFVRATVPVAEGLNDEALDDGAPDLLRAIAAAAVRADSTSAGQADAATPGASASPIHAALAHAALAHASTRVFQGFTLDQMVAEYRALRANVLSKWTLAVGDFSREAHDDQMRFNEALDTALADSAAQYAARLERARNLFLGVLGHDLRTPLAAIAHSAALLRHGAAAEGLRDEALERVGNSARRMDRMIQDLLDFTRTRLGTQLPMNPIACNVAELGKQAVDELSAFHPGTPIVFKAEGDLEGIWDCERIAQLLSNLVENAIRYRAGATPVSVEVRGLEGRIEISVHNVGKVIPPAEQKAIFDPLRRGLHEPPAGSAGEGGLGLGLYIAQQIAAAHGGGIRVSSSEAEGTRFLVTLARGGKGASEK